jgi:hypothetical protein
MKAAPLRERISKLVPQAYLPLLIAAFVTSLSPTSALGAEPEATAAAAPTVTEAPKPPPPPYSLPWQLRPVVAANVLRSDTSVSFYSLPGMATSGTTVSTMLLGTYKLTAELAPLVRVGYVYNDEPVVADGAPSGAALLNPILGATYASTALGLKYGVFGALTLPIGQGGGESPDMGAAKAAARGIPARAAMDNAMFAMNYLTMIGGVGAGYVKHGFTAQAELTVLELIRVRGPETEDGARTNFTAGVHLGYFPWPVLSVGGEVRYQRWLSDAAPVRANEAARETASFAVGPRLHLKLNGKQWLRPGLSYSRVLDAPWSSNDYQMVQLDVPFVF